MNEDKLKKFEDECNHRISRYGNFVKDGDCPRMIRLGDFLDLITAYRQLQTESDKKETEIVEILKQNLVLRGDKTKQSAKLLHKNGRIMELSIAKRELLASLKPFIQNKINIENGFRAGADFVTDETRIFNSQSSEVLLAYKVYTNHSTEIKK